MHILFHIPDGVQLPLQEFAKQLKQTKNDHCEM